MSEILEEFLVRNRAVTNLSFKFGCFVVFSVKSTLTVQLEVNLVLFHVLALSLAIWCAVVRSDGVMSVIGWEHDLVKRYTFGHVVGLSPRNRRIAKLTMGKDRLFVHFWVLLWVPQEFSFVRRGILFKANLFAVLIEFPTEVTRFAVVVGFTDWTHFRKGQALGVEWPDVGRTTCKSIVALNMVWTTVAKQSALTLFGLWGAYPAITLIVVNALATIVEAFPNTFFGLAVFFCDAVVNLRIFSIVDSLVDRCKLLIWIYPSNLIWLDLTDFLWIFASLNPNPCHGVITWVLKALTFVHHVLVEDVIITDKKRTSAFLGVCEGHHEQSKKQKFHVLIIL